MNVSIEYLSQKPSCEVITFKRKFKVVLVSDIDISGLLSDYTSKLNDTLLIHAKQTPLSVASLRSLYHDQPDLVLIACNFDERENSEAFREVCGFIRRLRKNAPQAKSVLQSRVLSDFEKSQLFKAGGSAWLDEALCYQSLETIILRMMTETEIPLSRLIGPGQIIRKNQFLSI